MGYFIVSICVFACIYTTVGTWVKEMENPGLYEGDIALDPDEKEGALKGNSFASIKGGRWPGGKIPYVITSSIGAGGRTAIAAAIAQYHQDTCLRFHRRTTESAYISFYRGGGCSSPVGYRYRRRNSISLATGCWRKGTVMHEIGHSIGLYHEQSRPDRDGYVRIIWNNISPGMAFNFNKMSTSLINSLGTPYDLASMMHYGAYAFGRGRMTIQTIRKSDQSLIRGSNGGFSKIDIKQIKLMYNCGKTATTTTNPNPTKCVWVEQAPVYNANCQDRNKNCRYWASRGECKRNPAYMKPNCCQSCNGGGGGDCRDRHSSCPGWARAGYCRSSWYTKKYCKKSCNLCDGGKKKVKKCWTITTPPPPTTTTTTTVKPTTVPNPPTDPPATTAGPQPPTDSPTTTTTTVKPTTVPNPPTDPPATTAGPQPPTDSKTSIPDPPTGPPKSDTE